MDEQATGEVRELNDFEFAQVYWEVLGPSRGAQILGWGVWWAVHGVKDRETFVRHLQNLGLGRRAAYVALKDLQRVADAVAAVEGRPPSKHLEDLAQRIAMQVGQVRRA